MRYIHYGSDHFDKDKFIPVKNRSYSWNKPERGCGLWASPVCCERSWRDWCFDEEWDLFRGSESFQFDISESANVLNLYSLDDMIRTMDENRDWIFTDPVMRANGLDDDPFTNVYLDFERMMADGIDAIDVRIKNLYYKLYGWDCDTILIMNPDIVEEVI